MKDFLSLCRLVKKPSFLLSLFIIILAISGTLLFPSFPVSATEATVLTKEASSVTSSTARLMGELTDWGTWIEADSYFEYGLDIDDLSSTTPRQAVVDTDSFGADISGLSPGTTYYFRAVAIEMPHEFEAGYGDVKSFTTATASLPQEEPPWREPEVKTVQATDISANSATLNGELIDLGTAAEVTVSFRYAPDRGRLGPTSAYEMAETGEFSITINDLSPGTTYHFRAFAKGEGFNYGADMTFQTLRSPTVITDPAVEITASSAVFNGTLADAGTAAGVTVFFEYGTTTDYGRTTISQQLTEA